jgi:hypothetical protein
VRSAQALGVNLLLDPQRIARLIEAEARLGDETYTSVEMFGDLRAAIWSELARGEATDTYRRNLQRAHLERLNYLMTAVVTPPPARARSFIGFTDVDVSQSDIGAYVRGELEALKREITGAIPRTRDRTTRLHLQDAVARIERMLDPRG